MTSYRFAACASALAVALAASAAGAEANDPLAAKFGARETIRSISLSPEGTHAVIVGPRPDGGENALVIALAPGGAVVPIFSSKGRTEQITWCFFVTEARVICELYLREGSNADVEAATRLVSLAADGSEMKLLSADATANAYYNARNGGDIIDYNVPGKPNSVLMTRWFAPEFQTGTLRSSAPPGLAVEEVDVATLDRRRVETARESAVWYATDGHGNVRLMGTRPTMQSGYAKREINFFYRPPSGGQWADLSSMTIEAGQGHGFQPIAVDAARNVVYGFDDKEGFQSLFERTLDGSNATTLVLGRDGVEIDNLIRIGRNQRIV
ncbi:MAG TPA: S9 family peptidase, partial [Croceibacterium sp.]|nr:S9 family peptidase [Croceibacterium sp.]